MWKPIEFFLTVLAFLCMILLAVLILAYAIIFLPIRYLFERHRRQLTQNLN